MAVDLCGRDYRETENVVLFDYRAKRIDWRYFALLEWLSRFVHREIQ
jgi:hypothetical protein